MGTGFAGGSTAGTGLASFMECVRGCRPGSVAPAVGGGYIVVINPAGVAVGPVFVLGAVQIAVFGRSAAVGAGFGVAALRTAISAENMIRPTGISPAFQFFATAVTLGVIAVHITVFIGINRFRAAVCTFLLIATGSTFIS